MVQHLWSALLAITLTSAIAIGARAEAVPVDVEVVRPDGSAVTVSAVELLADGVILHVAISTADSAVQLNPDGALELRDDLGGAHRFAPPADNRELAVAANSRFDGRLAFLGRLTPGARQLTLAASGADLAGLDLTIPLPGQTALSSAPGAAAPAPASRALADPDMAAVMARAPLLIPTDAWQRHPGGAVFTVRALTMQPEGIIVQISATNLQPQSIRLNGMRSLHLTDDSGVVYPVVPPVGNEEISVPGRSRLEANLLFVGQVGPGVRGLTLSSNAEAGGSAGDPATPLPVFWIPLGIAPDRLRSMLP